MQVNDASFGYANTVATARQASQGRDVTVSISARDADCAGANPVALTNSINRTSCSRHRFVPAAKVFKYVRVFGGFDIVILKSVKAILRAR